MVGHGEGCDKMLEEDAPVWKRSLPWRKVEQRREKNWKVYRIGKEMMEIKVSGISKSNSSFSRANYTLTLHTQAHPLMVTTRLPECKPNQPLCLDTSLPAAGWVRSHHEAPTTVSADLYHGLCTGYSITVWSQFHHRSLHHQTVSSLKAGLSY